MENEPDARRMAAAKSSLAGNSFGMLISPGMQGRRPMMGEPAASMINQGPVSTEKVSIPDKMAGLSGKQIVRLQVESRAQIQMAPDRIGLPERTCTITGSRVAIGRECELIDNIVETRGVPQGAGPSSIVDGQHNGDRALGPNVEVMIPVPKVGLKIGKGGKTIKQLQERGMQGRSMMGKTVTASMMDLFPISTEEVAVRDEMVGLSGKNVLKLQAKSQAKTKTTLESAGLPKRTSKITDSRKAKGRVPEVIDNNVEARGVPRDAGPPLVESLDGQHNLDRALSPNVEVMNPGPKIDSKIGKGGKIIKQLQERGMQGRSMMGKTVTASMMDLFPISTEEVAVRDEMVGLSGKNVLKLQAKSQAKTKTTLESAGLPKRTSKITDSRKAKGRVPEVIDNNVEARGVPRDAGPPLVESLDGQHNLDRSLGPNFTTSEPNPTPKKKDLRWKKKETERFFLALSMLGGNFDRMEKLFRHRNRKALVSKYHAELKKNPERVDRAMYLDPQVRFDIDKFSDESSDEKDGEKTEQTQLYAMDNSITRPFKRRSVEEPNCDKKRKRLYPSSELESSKKKPQSEYPTASTSESSSKSH